MKKEEKQNCDCNEEKCECNEDCDCNEEKCECGEDCDCTQEETPDKLNEAYNKISELEDLLIRSRAELINYRKRKDDEIFKMLIYSNEDLIIEILPTIDNFERAIKLDDENLTDELSKFLSGFKMIYCNLVSMLEKFDVKTIDEINIPFDPKYHQAVLTEKIDNKEQGVVIEILQKGYLLKDKVIRPAMVKVSE